MRSLIQLLFILFLNSEKINAQTTGSIENLLTSGSVQRWVLDSTTVHLGTECSNGVVFTFSIKNNTALKKYCENNRWKATTNLAWKIIPTNPGYKLELSDGTIYEVDYLEVNGQNLLRLRGGLSAQKSSPVQDYYFHKD